MDQDFRKIWQEQEVENMRISTDELRERARRFQRRMRWRNLREQGAVVLVVAAFGFVAVKSPALVPKVACCLIIAAAVVIGIYIQARHLPRACWPIWARRTASSVTNGNWRDSAIC